jgi:hypothetical protein
MNRRPYLVRDLFVGRIPREYEVVVLTQVSVPEETGGIVAALLSALDGVEKRIRRVTGAPVATLPIKRTAIGVHKGAAHTCERSPGPSAFS